MAGSYTAKIKFTADTSTLQRMERDMGGRFDRVSKRFGQGLSKAVKMISFGALATAGAAALTAILNPLGELNQQLNDTLEKADNIKDQAGAMGTSVKNYLKLQSAASTQGIDEGTLVQMSTRVSDLIGQAKEGDKNVLWQYRNETDMANALYKVIGDLSKVEDRSKRASLAGEIFGGRMTGRLAGLLEAGGFEPLIKEVLKGRGINNAAGSVEDMAAMEDQQSIYKAGRQLDDYTDKNLAFKLQGERKVIEAQNAYETGRLKKQNERMAGYANTASIQTDIDAGSAALIDLLNSAVLPVIADISSTIKKFIESKDPKDQAGMPGTVFMKYTTPGRLISSFQKNKKSGGPI